MRVANHCRRWISRTRNAAVVGAALSLLLAAAACFPAKQPERVYTLPVQSKAAEETPPAPAPAVDAGAAKKEEEPPDPAFADAPVKPLGREEIRILVKALPMRDDAIRFEAIDKFLLLYAPFTANKGLLRETRRAFRAAHGKQRVELSTFSLSTDVQGVGAIVHIPYKDIIFEFLAALSQGVSSTKNVIADFYDKVRDRDDVPDAEKNLIRAQIGSSPTSESYAGRNLRALESLRSSVEAFHH